jgi:glyoxylase-like metal-dependent hydrolase (beta-lactamase superfamily II)
MGSVSDALDWQVLSLRRPSLVRDAPAGKERLKWVADAATLILGAREAVLVDTLLTLPQTAVLARWIEASGRTLTTVYITRGRGPSVHGLAPLLRRFPRARALASVPVAAAMRAATTDAEYVRVWQEGFRGELAADLVAPDPMSGGCLQLEGHDLVAVDGPRSNNAASSCLFVPSMGLLLAGDVVCNEIHPYLAGTDRAQRRAWIACLDRLMALHPRAVVTGQKIPENGDDPVILGQTKAYLEDFENAVERTHGPIALYEAMLELYPDWVNPGALWHSCRRAARV